jgi:DNA-binding GntR family transcriptional regulator
VAHVRRHQKEDAVPVPHDRREVITRRLHKDEVYDRLLAAMVTGDLPAGARLRDVDLEAWSGVSRTPDRSALVRLERAGLVESTPRRRTHVARARPAIVPDLVTTLCALWRDLAREGQGLLAPGAVSENRRLLRACLSAVVVFRQSTSPRVDDSRAVVDAAFTCVDRLVAGASSEAAGRLLHDLGVRLRHQAALLGRRLDTDPLTACLVQVEEAVVAGDLHLLRSALDELARSTAPDRPCLAAPRSPWWPSMSAGLGLVSASRPAPGDDRRLLSDDAFRVLRDAVLDGTLEPGERLHDDELVSWLGISRTPIRSALDQLRGSGLVELSANRFTRVRDPDRAWLCDSAAVVASLHRAVAVAVLPGLDPRSCRDVAAELAAARPWVRRGDGLPASLELLRRVGLAVGGMASRSPGEVLGAALDEAELRLVHGLRARRCHVGLGAWDDFVTSAEAALDARDPRAWGDAVAAT